MVVWRNDRLPSRIIRGDGALSADRIDAMKKPLVSVIIEGYNEGQSFEAIKTIEGLKRQTFPLDQVELVLSGTVKQAEYWKKMYAGEKCFYAIKTVGAQGSNYLDLKNRGAEIASGEIFAFIDSDVRPEPTWLATMVHAMQNGAQVTSGVSLFQSMGGLSKDNLLMQIAASISWGGVISTVYGRNPYVCTAFHAHSVGFRGDLFRAHPYRTDMEGRLGGLYQYKVLKQLGVRIFFLPEQRAAHSFVSFRWWILELHRRYGYEALLLRRLDPDAPHSWVSRARIVEPLLTWIWRMLLDVPQWFKHSYFLGIGRARRILVMPLVLMMSALARGGEMLGAYATMFDPEGMKQFTANH